MMPKVYITTGWFGGFHVYVRDASRAQWIAKCKTIEVAESVKLFMETGIAQALAA